MSSPNNRVFQTLVTKGNKNLLAAGSFASALAPGQLGVFDYETGLSVDVSGTLPKKFYLAVGKGSGATLEDVASSANEYISGSEVTSATHKTFTAPVAQVVEVKDYKKCCGADNEYILKIDLVNEKILRTLGNVAYTKTYIASLPCEGDCKKQDINEVTKILVNLINQDADNFITAEPIDEAGAVIADIDAYIATNKAVNTDDDETNDVGSGIRITADPIKNAKFCGVNLKYYYPRGTTFSVYPTGAFECCSAKVEETVEPVYSQGAGYDVIHMESIAAGWNKKLDTTNRVSNFTYLHNPEFDADVNGSYDIFVIEYTVKLNSISTVLPGYNKTIVAVPKDDTNTLGGMNTLVGKLAQ